MGNMTKIAKIIVALFLVQLLALSSYSIADTLGNNDPIINSEIPITNGFDPSFSLQFSVNVTPGNGTVITEFLETSYVANNGYDAEGNIFIVSLSIVHTDGTLLANAPINLNVNVPSKDIVNGSIELPLRVIDKEKLNVVLGEQTRQSNKILAQEAEIGHDAMFKKLSQVKRKYMS